ncbi:hypothetical protein [Lysobacter tyrosinilyticus]
MVVHQYEGMEGDAVLAAGFAEQSPVLMAVVVVDEDGASIHSPLSDVHGEAG